MEYSSLAFLLGNNTGRVGVAQSAKIQITFEPYSSLIAFAKETVKVVFPLFGEPHKAIILLIFVLAFL